MKISNMYTSEEHKRNLGHFSDIVKLASVDGFIDEKEQVLIDRLMMILDITPEEYEDTLTHPERYQTKFASDMETRIELLYNLTRMLLIDGKVSEQGLVIIKRISTGLGFQTDKVDAVVARAINMFLKIPDIEDFSKEIKEVC